MLGATLVGMAVTASLGRWQLDRAAQKEALKAAHERQAHLGPLGLNDRQPGELADGVEHYRPAVARGHWLADRTVFLDNRQMGGRPGFYVVTPLRLSGRPDAVLVQRGWVARDLVDRTRLPAVPTPPGEVEVRGHIAPPPAKLYEFSAVGGGAIRQNLDLRAFQQEIGVPLWPISLVQAASAANGTVPDDGLLRDWPRPAVDVHKHYGYAFQWFALCALMAGLYVWFQLLRPRLRRVR
ncbi:transmembrane cytochrome oxidase [Caldimonas brevitalea]|uniref:SURF1-like protein n=1 Tax=Caldimonas brevitalea TaxID=413882 RepID=A0A0G3BEH6_9BURK|nr:transmembrane cytochrome oxidase [Caldimonas brevitalea]